MHIQLPFSVLAARQIVIFMGIQASGKSTFFKECLEPLGFTHINLDTLRTRRREADLIRECLLEGRLLTIDNTNPTRADRLRYIEQARQYGYNIVGIFFQSVLRDCIARNSVRQIKVPDKAVYATQNKLELPMVSEGFDSLYFAKITDGGFELSEWIS